MLFVGRTEGRTEISFFLKDNVRVHYNFGWFVKNAIVLTQ